MPTPISEVRALLDSADAAEATASVLALLQDAEIEAASITLPRTGGLVKPSDTLTLDAAGNLVVNDNDRPGGKRVFGDRVYQGSATHVSTGFDTPAEAVGVLLATIPITSAESQPGAIYRLKGKLQFAHGGSTGALVEVGLACFAAYDLLGATEGTFAGYQKSADKLRASADVDILLENAAGTFQLSSANPLPVMELAHTASGAILTAPSLSSGFPETITPGAQNLYLGFVIKGATGATTLTASWDLQLTVTKP